VTPLIQDWLGHRAIQHTARYTELSARRIAVNIAKLPELLRRRHAPDLDVSMLGDVMRPSKIILSGMTVICILD
jgi:hypothetical protein